MKNNLIDYNQNDYNNITESNNAKILYNFLHANIVNEDIKNFVLKSPICYNRSNSNLRDNYYYCGKVLYYKSNLVLISYHKVFNFHSSI